MSAPSAPPPDSFFQQGQKHTISNLRGGILTGEAYAPPFLKQGVHMNTLPHGCARIWLYYLCSGVFIVLFVFWCGYCIVLVLACLLYFLNSVVFIVFFGFCCVYCILCILACLFIIWRVYCIVWVLACLLNCLCSGKFIVMFGFWRVYCIVWVLACRMNCLRVCALLDSPQYLVLSSSNICFVSMIEYPISIFVYPLCNSHELNSAASL